jgi:uncharacterized protein (DUF952 family)
VTSLYHITERDNWLAAVQSGEYRMSTRGITLDEQGFIHCSRHHQLPAVAELVYGDVNDDELIVLVIDSDRVAAPIRSEAPEPGGEEFPHIYGPLPISAVTDTMPIGRDAEGHLALPG